MEHAIAVIKGRGDVFGDLKRALLELARELERVNVPLMLGGGYGLFLRQEELAQNGERTIIPQEQWPEPRSTQDLDTFMRSEVVADPTRWEAVREAVERLGYTVTENHEHWQFAKPLDASKTVILDLLTGRLDSVADKVTVDKRRARPKGRPAKKGDPGQPKIALHARTTPEAVALETNIRRLTVAGVLADSTHHTATIELPHPFPYLLMKLTAFDDRKEDVKKDFATHHALDIFRIVAMLTEPEFEETKQLCQVHAGDDAVKRARGIALDFFANQNLGIKRLREHMLGRTLPDGTVTLFQRALATLFSASNTGERR